MSLYPYLEAALVTLIGVFSLYHLLKSLMPRVVQRVCMPVLRWLPGSKAAGWAQAPAERMAGAGSSSGCGVGCITCNDCGGRARAVASEAKPDPSSR